MEQFPTREQVLEVIHSHAPQKLQSVLRDHLTPAITLSLQKVGDKDIAVGQSKIGGAPDVPPSFVWPTVRSRSRFVNPQEPLAFVAQFNLAEVAPFDLNAQLPADGLLSFFFLQNSMAWKVYSLFGFNTPQLAADLPFAGRSDMRL